MGSDTSLPLMLHGHLRCLDIGNVSVLTLHAGHPALNFGYATGFLGSSEIICPIALQRTERNSFT